MTSVLVCVDNSDAAGPALQAGENLARILTDGRMRKVHVVVDANDLPDVVRVARPPLEVLGGDPLETILAEARGRDVVAVVVGLRGKPAGRRPAGSIAQAVMECVRKPVLVVPPEAVVARDRTFNRVLLPLDGTTSTSLGADATLRTLVDRGARVIVLHVFHEETVPLFWDRSYYEPELWGREFLARNCERTEVKLCLHSGAPSTSILDTSEREAVDLITLVWFQEFSPACAHVVREVLQNTNVPVLLLPASRAIAASRAPVQGAAWR